jgi:hypothetical protein
MRGEAEMGSQGRPGWQEVDTRRAIIEISTADLSLVTLLVHCCSLVEGIERITFLSQPADLSIAYALCMLAIVFVSSSPLLEKDLYLDRTSKFSNSRLPRKGRFDHG